MVHTVSLYFSYCLQYMLVVVVVGGDWKKEVFVVMHLARFFRRCTFTRVTFRPPKQATNSL